MAPGSFVFCSCDSAVLDSEIQAKVDFYTVQRRAKCTSLGPEASKRSVTGAKCTSLGPEASKRSVTGAKCTSLGPEASKRSVTDSSLRRKDVPRRLMWSFFQPIIRAQHDELLHSVYSLLVLLSKPAPTDSSLYCLRGSTPTALSHHGCIRSPAHRSLLVLLCIPRTAAVPGGLCSNFYLTKDL